jgi:helicase MOV-10
MVLLDEAAIRLHRILSSPQVPNGMPYDSLRKSSQILNILQVNPRQAFYFVNGDYDCLFDVQYRTNQRGQNVPDQIRAKQVPALYAMKNDEKRNEFVYNHRLKKIASEFYAKVLKDDKVLRKQCEDRNRFTEEFTTWRENEKKKGKRSYQKASPGNILSVLRHSLKLVVTVVEGDKILWTHANDKPRSRKEQIKDLKLRVNYDREEMEKNRFGIEIDPITFGIDMDNGTAPLNTPLTQVVPIINNSGSTIEVNVKYMAATKKGISVATHTGGGCLSIANRSMESIRLDYTPTVTGVMKTFLSFDISSTTGTFDRFLLIRYITVRTGDQEDHNMLKAIAPYQKKENLERDAFDKPERIDKKDLVHNGDDSAKMFQGLDSFSIPGHIRRSLSDGAIFNKLLRLFYESKKVPQEGEIPSDLTSMLNIRNYQDIFQHLLWVEESQMQFDIRNYDMKNVILERQGRSYRIYVPGLAESRPSVLRGDKIYVRYSSKSYEGLVERTDMEHAVILLPRRIHKDYTNGMQVDVRFSFKRMGLRLCHDAVCTMMSQERKTFLNKVLFPEMNSLKALPPLNTTSSLQDIRWFNRSLNEEQRQAVQGVIQCTFRPLPYIIFGPPGTGKTVTLCESILQTVRARGSSPNFRLLVCAPSNTAVDLILQRLAEYLQPDEMLRILAFSRDKSTVPPDVMKYSYFCNEQNGFVIPPNNDIVKSKKVVCVTLSTGGKLPYHNLMGHFTHVMIDEAGHAMEPEVLSCIAKTVKVSTKQPPVIVLAGDPKQLGPIIRSNIAKSFGLEKSLLERMHERIESYEDRRFITTLVQNYRSHPKILELSNHRFYNGKLQACADKFVRENLQNWEHLPKKGFPLIFHGVEGQDSREGNSPSWFNPDECQIVKYYVDNLVRGTRSNKVKPEEIGIVTPYHKQGQKIRSLLAKHGYSECKVGSVEEFQGSERRVIIISTVRSSVEYINFDNKHKLGFVANPKRFNVAITRAQALLIIIGNPRVLAQDGDWNALLEFCIQGGGYTGCDYTLKQEDSKDDSGVDEMCSDTEEDRDGKEYEMVSAVTGQEGPAWRSEE